MTPANKWKIPYKSGTSEYTRAYAICQHCQKPFPELTETLTKQEQTLYNILTEAGGTPLTHKELVQRSGMVPRTVRYIIHQFIDRGLVLQKHNFRDGRSPLYVLKVTTGTPAEGEEATP